MIRVKSKGSFINTETFLKKNEKKDYTSLLRRYGQQGVDLLRTATPVDTGATAESWSFKIVETATGTKLEWYNDNVSDNIPVVVLLVYGHGCQNGTYVEGYDFVTPAMKPLFESMAKKLIREVE